MNELVFEITAQHQGERLDKIICSEEESVSRSTVQKLIADGKVTVNGRIATKSLKVKAGDEVKILVNSEFSDELAFEISFDASDAE